MASPNESSEYSESSDEEFQPRIFRSGERRTDMYLDHVNHQREAMTSPVLFTLAEISACNASNAANPGTALIFVWEGNQRVPVMIRRRTGPTPGPSSSISAPSGSMPGPSSSISPRSGPTPGPSSSTVNQIQIVIAPTSRKRARDDTDVSRRNDEPCSKRRRSF